MGGLFGGGPKAPPPVAPPPVAPPPQIDDAVAKTNAEDAAARKQGRRTTILTSDTGLPNLGTTTKTGQ